VARPFPLRVDAVARVWAPERSPLPLTETEPTVAPLGSCRANAVAVAAAGCGLLEAATAVATIRPIAASTKSAAMCPFRTKVAM
jgi:hypothetical protein